MSFNLLLYLLGRVSHENSGYGVGSRHLRAESLKGWEEPTLRYCYFEYIPAGFGAFSLAQTSLVILK